MAYLAKTGLRYPVGDTNIELAKAGDLESVTEWREVEPGDVIDDVPEVSLPWLLEGGHIEEVAP